MPKKAFNIIWFSLLTYVILAKKGTVNLHLKDKFSKIILFDYQKKSYLLNKIFLEFEKKKIQSYRNNQMCAPRATPNEKRWKLPLDFSNWRIWKKKLSNLFSFCIINNRLSTKFKTELNEINISKQSFILLSSKKTN